MFRLNRKADIVRELEEVKTSLYQILATQENERVWQSIDKINRVIWRLQ